MNTQASNAGSGLRAAALLAVLFAAALASQCKLLKKMKAGPEAGREEEPPAANARPEFFIGVKGEYWGEDLVTLYPMKLAGGDLAVGEEIELPRGHKDHYPAMAVDGHFLYAARGRTVERTAPFMDGPRLLSVKMDWVPTALFGYFDTCFVGSAGRVHRIDFTSTTPEASLVYNHGQDIKPVDFFLRFGKSWLIAVDDEVWPKFGFFLDLESNGEAEHRFTADFPTGANEEYFAAADGDGRLLIAATYGVMDGSGNRLYDCALEKTEVTCKETEEWERRGGSETQLLAGGELTYWNGMGILENRIVIGAGERGILHMPVDTPGRNALLQPLELGVFDLIVFGDRVVALVLDSRIGGKPAETDKWEAKEKNDRIIVVLKWDKEARSFKEESRHGLDVRIDALVLQ